MWEALHRNLDVSPRKQPTTATRLFSLGLLRDREGPNWLGMLWRSDASGIS